MNFETFTWDMNMRFLAGLFTFCLIMNVAGPLAIAATSTVVDRYEDWTVYKAETDDGALCFAASTPKDYEPKNVNRGDIFFYITTWPKYKVSQEVSVKLGYPLKDQSSPTLTIGARNFTLFEKGDRAYIHSSLEPNLVKAMKAGAKMTLKGVSKRGTETTDIYSLSGVTAALKAAEKACQ